MLILFCIIPNVYADTISSELEKELILKLGDKATIDSNGIVIKFLTVSDDSRCPLDVICVWQGKASVIINIQVDGQDYGNYELSTEGNRNSVTVNQYNFQMKEILPYPTSIEKAKPSDYSIKLFVSKATTQKTIDCATINLEHKIVGGKVVNACRGIQTISVSITINADSDGKIVAEIPGKLVYSIGDDCKDDDFVVLLNGKSVEFDQKFSISGRILTISFEKGVSRIDVLGSQTLSDKMPSMYCGITQGYSKLYLPPKLQHDLGMPIDEIKCNEGLFLVIKNQKTEPSCVSSETKTKLIERNWASLEVKEISNNKKLVPYPGAKLGDEHEHAILLVKIFGEDANFARPNFQLQSKWIHFENDNGYTIHRHAKNVTLGFLFKTLNMDLDKDCLLTYYGKEFCSNQDFQLKFFINGNKTNELGNYVIKENDRILITYGNYSENKINEYLNEVKDKELFPEKPSEPVLKYV